MFNLFARSLPNLFRSNTKWLERQQTSILSAAAIITVFNIISAGAGFMRNWVFISFFYDTPIASKEALDALFVSFQIPDTLFQIIIFGAMSAAFIPMFITYKKQDEKVAFQMTSILMTWLLFLFALVSLVIFLLAEPLTIWRTGVTYTHEQIQIVTNLTRIMLVGQFFLAMSSFFGSIINSYQRFIIPALAPILYNVGVISGVWILSPYFGIYSAGIGMIIGAFIHMIIQLPLAYKLGFRYHLSFNLKYPGVMHIFKLTPPRLLAVSVNEFQNLLLGFFATSIGNSSMTTMQLALTIMYAPIRFFSIPISQASLPFLSEEAIKNDQAHFRDLIIQSLNQIAFLIFPASALVLILRIPIVRLLYGAGNFPWEATQLTGKVVAIIALSIAAQGMVHLLVRAFYALKDTKTPLFIAICDVGSYIFFSYVSVFWLHWGVLGLAAATTASAFIELILILYFLNRRVACFTSKAFVVPQLKILAASFFMAVFLYLPYRILDLLVFQTSRTIELIGLTITTSTVGMLVYLFFSALFEVKELTYLTNLLTTFSSWWKPLEKSPEVLVDAGRVEGDNPQP